MPTDPTRVQALFLAAIDLSEPATRSAFVREQCAGDDELLDRVEALLRAHDNPDSLLDVPAVAPPDPAAVSTRAFHNPHADPGDGPTRTHGEGSADFDDALGFLAAPQRPDSLGRIGHYEVIEVLGRGGFGIVYRAFDDVLQRVVAVKVLTPSMAATSPARKRFIREAQSSAKVQHENVVRVHAVEEHPLPYLVMEFVSGETLQQRLDRTGPLGAMDAIRIARQVAEGLAAAHGQGLIHRDIKPSNILIERVPQDKAKITDFGLARAVDDASLTRSGIVAGTPMYMAPEQAKGEALDHRADLFGLGSVIYALLTGHPPFRAETTLAVLKRVAEDTPRPIREVIPEVPEWLCRIVEKLHAKNPAERFQTAREVADLLADCEKQLAAHKELTDFARIPGGAPKAVARRSRFRRAAVTAGLLSVVTAALAVTVFKSAIYRFAGNRAEVEFSATDPEVLKLQIRRDGQLVATLDRTNPRTVLAPGEYEVEAVCADGCELGNFSVESIGFGTGGAFSRPDGRPTAVLTVNRGAAVAVRATAEKRAVPPPGAAVAPMPHEPPALDPRRARLAQLLVSGKELVRKGRQLDLEPIAEEALKIDPESPGALALRATLRGARNDIVGATADADTALKLNPETVQALVLKGQFAGIDGKFDEAIAYATCVLRLDPKSGAGWNNRATNYYRKGEHRQAIADATRAIEVSRNFVSPYLTRGAAHASLGAYEKAIADYDAAAKISSTDYRIFVQRSRVYDKTGDKDRADADWKAAETIAKRPLVRDKERAFPDPPKPVERKKLTAEESADLGRVLASFDRAWKAGNGPACQKAADESCRIDPTSAAAHSARARYLAITKQLKEALTEANEALRLDPNDAWAYSVRGAAKADAKDYAGSIADQTIAVGLDPSIAQAWDARGYAYLERGQYQQALTDMTEAIRFAPSATRYQHRGKCYLHLGEYKKALAEYEASSKLDAQDKRVWMMRAALKAQLRDPDGTEARDREEAHKRGWPKNLPLELPTPLLPAKRDPELVPGTETLP
jgi:serine/threonine protein kinase/tetratricopeptide (TPR) repeat protein